MKQAALIACVSLLAFLSCAGERPAARVSERRGVEQVITHRVESGETWHSLARDFYGDERRAGELARDNGADVKVPPRSGAAVRVFLGARDVERAKRRLDAAREYNEGLDLASEQNYGAAAAKFEEAMKLDPSFRDASFNLAISYDKLGFREKAVRILKDLVSLAPENGEYRYALGASLFGAGAFEGAERAFRDVLKRDAHNRKALFSLAVVLEKRGSVEEAKSRFREYLELEPRGEWAEEARFRLDALLRSGGGAR